MYSVYAAIVALPPSLLQHEDGKLEDLLKEVAETEVPADAPAPPPDEPDELETEEELLPSQREKATGE